MIRDVVFIFFLSFLFSLRPPLLDENAISGGKVLQWIKGACP